MTKETALTLKLRRDYQIPGVPGFRYLFRYIAIYQGKGIIDTLADVAEYYNIPFRSVQNEYYKLLNDYNMTDKDVKELIKWYNTLGNS